MERQDLAGPGHREPGHRRLAALIVRRPILGPAGRSVTRKQLDDRGELLDEDGVDSCMDGPRLAICQARIW
jgi:hypothetical protein